MAKLKSKKKIKKKTTTTVAAAHAKTSATVTPTKEAKRSGDDSFLELSFLLECDRPSCTKSSPSVVCTRCACTYYCSSYCQRVHWDEGHGLECTRSTISTSEMLLVELGSDAPMVTVPNSDTANQFLSTKACEAKPTTPNETNKENAHHAQPPPRKCGICWTKKMERPVELSCHHVFCHSCLATLLDYYQRSPPLHNACPYCRISLVGDGSSDQTRPRGPGRASVEMDHAQALVHLGHELSHNGMDHGASQLCHFAAATLEPLVATQPDSVAAWLLAHAWMRSPSTVHQALRTVRDLMDSDTNQAQLDELEDLGMWSLLTLVEASQQITLAQAYEAAGRYEAAHTEYMVAHMLQMDGSDELGPNDVTHDRDIIRGLVRTSYQLQHYEQVLEWVHVHQNRRTPGLHKLVAQTLLKLAAPTTRRRPTARAPRPMYLDHGTQYGYTQTLHGAIAAMYHGLMYEDPSDEFNKRANRKFLQTLCDQAERM